jgi:hypothetical protein
MLHVVLMSAEMLSVVLLSVIWLRNCSTDVVWQQFETLVLKVINFSCGLYDVDK